MDWNVAIEMNREALKRVLASLVAMAGFASVSSLRGDANDAGPASLPRHLHRMVLRLLRPAEAAARRLVIVAARGIVVAPSPPRLCKAQSEAKAAPLFVRDGIVPPIGMHPDTGRQVVRPAVPPHARAFSLFDPLRPPFRRRPTPSGVPRIWAPGCRDPVAIPARKPPMPDDPIDAARLGLRLAALASALDDLPRHAVRFARWRNRAAAGTQNEDPAAAGTQNGVRAAAGTQNRQRTTASRRGGRSRFHRLSPLRPGPPPGSPSGKSRRSAHEVHEILARCHGLAFWVLQHRDTS